MKILIILLFLSCAPTYVIEQSIYKRIEQKGLYEIERIDTVKVFGANARVKVYYRRRSE